MLVRFPETMSKVFICAVFLYSWIGRVHGTCPTGCTSVTKTVDSGVTLTSSPTVSTFAQCCSECTDDPNCDLFSFKNGENICNLFTKTGTLSCSNGVGFKTQLKVDSSNNPCTCGTASQCQNECESLGTKIIASGSTQDIVVTGTANTIAECCALCVDYNTANPLASPCIAVSFKDAGNGDPCKHYSAVSGCLSNTNFGWITRFLEDNNGNDCPCAVADGDPHFITLDGYRYTALLPVGDSKNEKLKARYVYLRTVNCTRHACQGEQQVPPLNFEISLTNDAKDNRSRITGVYLQFFYQNLFGSVGVNIDVSIELIGKHIGLKITKDGKEQKGPGKYCSIKGSDGVCPADEIEVGLNTQGSVVQVRVQRLGLELSFDRHHNQLDVDLANSKVNKCLHGNIMGLLGNNDGNRNNDLRCGAEKVNAVRFGKCMEVASDGSQNTLKKKTHELFFTCPSETHRLKSGEKAKPRRTAKFLEDLDKEIKIYENLIA